MTIFYRHYGAVQFLPGAQATVDYDFVYSAVGSTAYLLSCLYYVLQQQTM